MPLRKAYADHDDAERVGPDTDPIDADTGPLDDETPHERSGGFSVAGAFFGWLVAATMTVLLAGLVGAGAIAASRVFSITWSQAMQQAETFGLASALALLVILMIGYFTGGYVAGRMSRFDGGRQGGAVWLLGLIVTVLVAGLGAIFGPQYGVVPRVNLPSVPIPTNTVTVGGVVTLFAVVLGTRLTAVAGGRAGQRYQTEIDRAVT